MEWVTLMQTVSQIFNNSVPNSPKYVSVQARISFFSGKGSSPVLILFSRWTPFLSPNQAFCMLSAEFQTGLRRSTISTNDQT